MKVYVTAVGNMHREKGLTNKTLDDTVQRAMTGFKRLQGERKDARAPVTAEVMLRLRAALDSTT